MRDLVLNDVSIRGDNDQNAIDWLLGVTSGLATLISHGISTRSLRSRFELFQVPVSAELSLYDVLMRISKTHREEFALFAGLVTKAPLLKEVGADVADRFLGSEAIDIDPADGEPLVLCAQMRGIAVGFPSAPHWDTDQLVVKFSELVAADRQEEHEERVDSLTRDGHAVLIRQRHQAFTRDGIIRGVHLWQHREAAFPHLRFGLDVPEQLEHLDANLLQSAIARLAELDAAVAAWRGLGGPAPDWPCKVTPESTTTMNDQRLRSMRIFRSSQGAPTLYEWHARLGSAWRIHLTFDAATQSLEVGYIGHHLPY